MALLYLLLLPWRQVYVSIHPRTHQTLAQRRSTSLIIAVKGCGDQFNNCFNPLGPIVHICTSIYNDAASALYRITLCIAYL